MSRSETNEQTEKTLAEIWRREKAFGEAVQASADAEHLWKIEKAKAFLAADGTEKAREAKAMIDTEDLHKDFLTKQAAMRFLREKLRDAQSALSARQSLMSYDAKTNFGYTNRT